LFRRGFLRGFGIGFFDDCGGGGGGGGRGRPSLPMFFHEVPDAAGGATVAGVTDGAGSFV